MDITKERFEDAGEQDEDGYYDYYYAGFIYRIVCADEAFVVRRYEDTPTEAAFLHREVKGKRKWRKHHFDAIPYDSLTFREAVKHLVQNERVRQVTVLLNDYVLVNLNRIA